MAFQQQLGVAQVGGQRVDLAGLQHQHAIVERTDRDDLDVVRQLLGDQVILQRAVLCADLQAGKILGGGVVCALTLCHQHGLAAVLGDVKRGGQLHVLGALLGSGKAGDGDVRLTGRDGRLHGGKIHRADFQLDAQLFGDVFCKLDVRADILRLAAAQVLKLQRGKVGAGGQHQLAGFQNLFQAVLGRPASAHGCHQHRRSQRGAKQFLHLFHPVLLLSENVFL